MSNLEINGTAKGKLRVQKKDAATGEVKYDSGEFDNLLLNNFFSGMSHLYYCFASTDSSVSPTDTTLASMGSTNDGVSTSSVTVDANGLMSYSLTRVYTFVAGAIVGNLSCIGLSNTSTVTGTNLKVKSLVKDVNGDPTTIPVTASDQLIITHTLVIQYNQRQELGTFNIDGVNYEATFYTRAAFSYSAAYLNRIYPSTGVFINGSSTTQQENFQAVFAAASTFTPPTIPQGTFGYLSLANGERINAKTITANNTYNSASAEEKATFSYTLAANDNFATATSVAAIGFYPSPSGSNTEASCNFVVAFNPPLPKTPSIAYSFTVALKLSRA